LFVPDGAGNDAWAKCPECRQFFELKNATSRELSAVELVDSNEVATGALASEPSEEAAAEHSTSAAEQMQQFAQEPDVDVTDHDEVPEDAAQRIDAWFRSAKTLSDVPNLERAAASPPADVPEPAEQVANLDSDLQLETPSALPSKAAPWDDSQHMDRLLADFQNEPSDTFEPSNQQAISEADRTQPAVDRPDDIPFSIQLVNKQRRKRPLARTLLMSAVGAVIGLSLGYYALLWIRGPQLDFLDLARYLPKAALPASFRPAVKQSPIAPPSTMVDDLAASEKVVAPASQQPIAPTDSAEQPATYTSPAEPPKTVSADDDRYGAPTTKNDAGSLEPAPLEAPAATPLATNPPPAEPVRVANAPSFGEADVTAALKNASEAEPVLAKGSWTESAEVAQAKGKSYMALADLAQKATFVETTGASADATKLQQQADEFFKRALSDAHLRNEVAQMVPRWLNHPKRPQNGVFLAGNVTRGETKGSVVEYSIELAGGPTVAVLVPASGEQPVEAPGRPAVVAGLIVDQPAEAVAGYTGSAPQAVFAKKLIPLD
jgi:hypothetical protein